MGFGPLSTDQFMDSLQSTEIDFSGFPLRGIQNVKPTEEYKRDRVYGNGPFALGLPIGTHEAGVDFSMILKEFDRMVGSLGDNYSQIPATMGLNFRRPTDGTIYSLNATSVYINKTELEAGKAGSSDPSLVSLTAYILDAIDWNGIVGLFPSASSFSVPILTLGF